MPRLTSGAMTQTFWGSWPEPSPGSRRISSLARTPWQLGSWVLRGGVSRPASLPGPPPAPRLPGWAHMVVRRVGEVGREEEREAESAVPWGIHFLAVREVGGLARGWGAALAAGRLGSGGRAVPSRGIVAAHQAWPAEQGPGPPAAGRPSFSLSRHALSLSLSATLCAFRYGLRGLE